MKPDSVPETTGFDPVRLIQDHQAGVWRYLRGLGCDSSQADDLTQETFLAVLKRPFEDYNKGATGAYLRRVAHNLFISQYRRAGKFTEIPKIEEFETVWCEWFKEDNGEELLVALRSCLAALGDRARWALEMRFRDQLSRNEIAAALQISEHGAKNLMQRAKTQLRACVESKIK